MCVDVLIREAKAFWEKQTKTSKIDLFSNFVVIESICGWAGNNDGRQLFILLRKKERVTGWELWGRGAAQCIWTEHKSSLAEGFVGTSPYILGCP